jgi:hypothetical protein
MISAWLALLVLAAAALTSQSLLTSRNTARWLRIGEWGRRDSLRYPDQAHSYA